MMLTRCPACQTVFRLHPEQLDARGGEVRCGHCFHPFNAREHSFEAPAQAKKRQDTPIIETPRPAAPAETDFGAGLDFDIPDTAFTLAPNSGLAAQGTGERWDIGAPDMPAPDASRAQATMGLGWAPRVDHEAPARSAPEFEPRQAAPSSITAAPAFPEVLRKARRANTNDGADIPPPLPSGYQAARGSPSTEAGPEPEPEPEAAATTTSTAAGAWTRSTRNTEAEPEPEPDAADDAPDLDRLDATYGRPPHRRSPVVRAFGALLVITLTTSLGAQLTYQYRTDIARELPGLRPLLEQACVHLKCSVPYPRNAEHIAIEASDLQAEPGKPGHYVLRATLNNRAQYAQHWPHLELTLTDAGDNPVSRRVLAPDDWLPADARSEAFAGRKLIDLSIPFEATGIAPTGYRIYAFYP